MSQSLKCFHHLKVWKGIFQSLQTSRWAAMAGHIRSLLRNSSLKISVRNKFLSTIKPDVFLKEMSLNSRHQLGEGAPTSWLQNSPWPQQREEPWRPSEAALYLQSSRCSATAGHPEAFAVPLLFWPGLGLHLQRWSTGEEIIRCSLSWPC